MSSPTKIPKSAQVTIEEYIAERIISSKPVILVEGEYDNLFFQLLLDQIKLIETTDFSNKQFLNEIEIDTADRILSPEDQQLGNREKVETTCRLAQQKRLDGKLVGFVDREFREFTIDDTIIDNICTHRQDENLFWSRGHSIENYLFDQQVLSSSFRIHGISSNSSITDTLNIFNSYFNQLLRIATSLSFASKQDFCINLVQKALNKSLFSFDETVLHLDINQLSEILLERQMPENKVQSLIEAYNLYLGKLSTSESDATRWACHGHIGLELIWCFFLFCFDESSSSSSTINNLARRDRFLQITNSWCATSIGNDNWISTTPSDCIKYLIDTAA